VTDRSFTGNGIVCSDLHAAAFRAMGVAVTERTLAGGVSEDQELFWAWATQLYAGATHRRLDTAEEVSIYEAGGVLQRFAQDFLASSKAA